MFFLTYKLFSYTNIFKTQFFCIIFWWITFFLYFIGRDKITVMFYEMLLQFLKMVYNISIKCFIQNIHKSESGMYKRNYNFLLKDKINHLKSILVYCPIFTFIVYKNWPLASINVKIGGSNDGIRVSTLTHPLMYLSFQWMLLFHLSTENIDF